MASSRVLKTLLILGLAALPIGGCASQVGPAGTSEGQEERTYFCSGARISSEAIAARTPLDELTEPGRTALADAVFDDGSPLELRNTDDWFLAAQTETDLAIIRSLDDGPDGAPGAPDHELMTVSWVEATNFEGWLVTSSGTCALTLDLGELGVAAISIDPASPPDPGSREVHLLITEQACNSGQDAAGRIEVVRIDESDEAVGLVIGVRPRGGAQSCPSNPATPFAVTLSEPLDERALTNATLKTPLPLVD
jgi:hypothetical protein